MTQMKSLQPIPPGQEMPRPYLMALLQTAQSMWQGPNRNTALRFSRHLALAWLAYYPGDLPVNLLYSQALTLSGSARQAVPILKDLCLADPEYFEAQQLLRSIDRPVEEPPEDSNLNLLAVLTPSRGDVPQLAGWASALRNARQFLLQDELEQAEQAVHQALLEGGTNPLTAVIHLRVSALRQPSSLSMQKLASHYHGTWPGCIAPILFLADALMDGGSAEEAVALLHQAATRDVIGQVVTRLWGPNHPYRNLWPTELKAPIDVPVPADIASAFGWNRLPAPELPANLTGTEGDRSIRSKAPSLQTGGDTDDYDFPKQDRGIRENPERSDPLYVTPTSQPNKTKPDKEPPVIAVPFDSETDAENDPDLLFQDDTNQTQNSSLVESLYPIQAELEEIAARLNKRHLARIDGRFPVYVVFSTRKGLEQHFGSKSATLITEMKRLATTIAARNDWDSALILADDAESTTPFGLQPVVANDPWKLKLLLTDLDSTLSKRGEMIGALLIVGGPEVVPFHHLPNPVDDNDSDVPSDNPYATRDENYFIPEWPVGRLPTGKNADVLLNILADITTHHLHTNKQQTWYEILWNSFLGRLISRTNRVSYSWGYTAAVWRRASISVFRPIGESHAMSVSPPVQVDTPASKPRNRWVPPTARLGYFNLHGVKDGADWYGQRDPAEPTEGPDYPIALRPQDVKNSGHAPQIVFSEACYGAHILGKTIEEAMALKFLASGSLCMIGSTTISYGSVTPPLIAADLLSNAFWKFLKGGLPAGEALRRAKIHLAREMNRRQNYLDGEDQKTLISFVYYGDPLAQPTERVKRPKAILRSIKIPGSIPTVCDKVVATSNNSVSSSVDSNENNPIPPEVITQVKAVVDKYLPGMAGARMSLSYERFECTGDGHTCPTSQLSSKGGINVAAQRRIITLSKQVDEEPDPDSKPDTVNMSHTHWHHARLTLDNQGRVIKLAVSR